MAGRSPRGLVSYHAYGAFLSRVCAGLRVQVAIHRIKGRQVTDAHAFARESISILLQTLQKLADPAASRHQDVRLNGHRRLQVGGATRDALRPDEWPARRLPVRTLRHALESATDTGQLRLATPRVRGRVLDALNAEAGELRTQIAARKRKLADTRKHDAETLRNEPAAMEQDRARLDAQVSEQACTLKQAEVRLHAATAPPSRLRRLGAVFVPSLWSHSRNAAR